MGAAHVQTLTFPSIPECNFRPYDRSRGTHNLDRICNKIEIRDCNKIPVLGLNLCVKEAALGDSPELFPDIDKIARSEAMNSTEH